MKNSYFPFLGAAVAREATMETPNRRPDRVLYGLGWRIDIFQVRKMVLIEHRIWGGGFPKLQHLALRESFEFDPVVETGRVNATNHEE